LKGITQIQEFISTKLEKKNCWENIVFVKPKGDLWVNVASFFFYQGKKNKKNPIIRRFLKKEEEPCH
jgi:hypothetical protein